MKTMLDTQSWPTFDPSKLETDEVVMAVQIDGKVRGNIRVSRNEGEDELKNRILELPNIQKWLKNGEPKKIIVVPGKIISIVT